MRVAALMQLCFCNCICVTAFVQLHSCTVVLASTVQGVEVTKSWIWQKKPSECTDS